MSSNEVTLRLKKSDMIKFLGINFWNHDTSKLISLGDQSGGLLVVPASPAIAEIESDDYLAQSYRAADWAVVDGGYLAIWMRIILKKTIIRISGLQILHKLLGFNGEKIVDGKNRTILWITPKDEENIAISKFLEGLGYLKENQHFYTAPFYNDKSSFKDIKLFDAISDVEPDWIILCIGGGRQEKLGYEIKKHLNDSFINKERVITPFILCTGGAISFLSGTQANIPNWADRFYLGWFFRLIRDPKTFFPRYFKAIWSLPKMLFKQKNK